MNKIKQLIKSNLIWIIFIISLIIVIAIAENIFKKDIMLCDTISYDFVINYLRNDVLTTIVKIITNFGSALILIVICLLSLILLKNKRKSICIILNLVIITILNQVLKFIVQRPRPDVYRIINESGYSFPSGHSMVSMAFYGFLIYLIYNYIKIKKERNILCVLLAILIVLIGFSRVYLGVHYLSDVIAGFFISIAYLIIFIKLISRYIKNNEKTS